MLRYPHIIARKDALMRVMGEEKNLEIIVGHRMKSQ
jgi:hypothetical protein